jgi:predicted dithiol-disulfide oxidoreductase (DUF899 family)
MKPRPDLVSASEWQRLRDQLLVDEKAHTRAGDALAARRRRLPMVQFDVTKYEFATPAGPKSLLDLFDGRDQLVIYQHMDVGPDSFCPGCTHFMSNVRGLDTLAECGVSWATVSNMPLAQLEGRSKEMGWNVPIASSRGTAFTDDCGADTGFMLSTFFADGPDVFRTYNTRGRGVEPMLFPANIADRVVYGRQEEWEDSPPGWPQHPTYG